MKRVRLTEWRSVRGALSIAVTTLAVVWVAGCDGDGMRGPAPPTDLMPPANLVKVSGDGQSATRASLLAEPFVVKVTDASGQPVADVNVQWTVVRGDGSPSSVSSVTKDDGLASVRYTVGTQLAEHVVRARHGDLEPVDFYAQAVAAPAVDVAAEAGDGQTARTSQPLAAPLVARVMGADGFGVPDVEVNWSVTAGGGALSEHTTSTDRTGRTSVSYSMGPEIGSNRVSATVSGVNESASASATFQLSATRPVSVVVEMKDTAFVAPDGTDLVTILLGDTVRWVNVDTAALPVIRVTPVFDCVPPDTSNFLGPDVFAVGTTVEWVYGDWLSPGCSARIVSTSAPPEGEHFDSGVLAPGERFQFVPQVAGTWEYVDTLNSGSGTLTAVPEYAPPPVRHTATSNRVPEGGTSFDSGLLDPGQGFEFVPGVRGTWRYECELHCSLDDLEPCSAVIVVQ